MRRRKILCTVGTRPEVIKMAPVIRQLQREDWAIVQVLATAQHREMLDQVLGIFEIAPDFDLDLMRPDQQLADLTARLLLELDRTFAAERPDCVLAQGDTTTVLATALACFYRRIPFLHVEAGLRTGNPDNPFPEEMNRVLVSRLARFHFAPTAGARANLLREGLASDAIAVTGNTVIDALMWVAAKDIPIGIQLDPNRRLIVVTAHRRENFGAPLLDICRALRRLAEHNPDVEIVYPVHPNPNVRVPVERELGGHPRIRLCEPLAYGPFVSLLKRAYLIMTDSGGIQEEAPALGKPVLVLRSETERPEAVEAGVVRVIGARAEMVEKHAQELLDSPGAYHAMAKGCSPYGDGHATERILAVVRRLTGVESD